MEEDVSASDAVLQLDLIDPDAVPGMYVCVATNEAGNATLTVNIPPFHSPPLHAEPPDAIPTPTPEAFIDRIATFANQFRRDKARDNLQIHAGAERSRCNTETRLDGLPPDRN